MHNYEVLLWFLSLLGTQLPSPGNHSSKTLRTKLLSQLAWINTRCIGTEFCSSTFIKTRPSVPSFWQDTILNEREKEMQKRPLLPPLNQIHFFPSPENNFFSSTYLLHKSFPTLSLTCTLPKHHSTISPWGHTEFLRVLAENTKNAQKAQPCVYWAPTRCCAWHFHLS